MDAHRLLSPRITVLITTADKKGEADVAPYSFVMPVSFDPPMIAVGVAPQRHTMANINETGEFVVNLCTSELTRSVMAAARAWRPGLDKIGESWLSKTPGKKVKAPRIKEAIAWMECKLEWSKLAGDHYIVVGKVVQTDGLSDVEKDGVVNLEKYPILMHLGGKQFIVPGTIVEV